VGWKESCEVVYGRMVAYCRDLMDDGGVCLSEMIGMW
jgi:hypothetical protein